tara:strand:- start:163 stop:615 length:453 start_codon:yes stop_codon:yes gene_type:complete
MIKISYMQLALNEARSAALSGEVPVGAVVVDPARSEILALASNRMEELGDPTAHAEMIAIRRATENIGQPRLVGCDLYVTLEPCPMCAAAISLARVRRLYFGAYDMKGGGVEHGPRIFQQTSCNHKPEIIGGMQEKESGLLLARFFRTRR